MTFGLDAATATAQVGGGGGTGGNGGGNGVGKIPGNVSPPSMLRQKPKGVAAYTRRELVGSTAI
ncbi:MAG: hypothetical protein DMF59_13105 [Acidobacteria bacterium]|nr:MAG: hypothetical protein DMF59_13105 [Acidobacteriota bacterium]